ncbi:U1 [Hyposoter didymator ichnovirus]|nr:U1 [Hyposoter didymator ichnovirus]
MDSPSSSIMEVAVPKRGSKRLRCKSEPNLVKIHAPATPYQLDHMIAYLERNPHLAMRKFQKPGTSYDPSASWEQLAEELNALWVNGAPKDAKTWKTTWYTQRKGVMRRIRKIHQIRTSNKRSRFRPRKLSLRDQKILALSEFSDEDEIKEAMLHTVEENLKELPGIGGASKSQTNLPGMQSTRSDIDGFYTNQQLLEALEGFETPEVDSLMLKGSPRVRLVPLSASEVAAIIPDLRESLRQRELPSALGSEVTELASAPVPQTEQDSSSAALQVTEPAPEPVPQTNLDSPYSDLGVSDSDWEPRHRRGRSSSCAATNVMLPATKSYTRTTNNSLDAGMSPKQLEWKPRSQKKRGSESAAREATKLASELVTQTEQDASFADLEATEPDQRSLLRSGRSSSCSAIRSTYPASKLRSRLTGGSLDAGLGAIEQTRDSTSTAETTPEPLPPKERNLSPTPTPIEAATSSERSQSPNQEESSRPAAVNKAAAFPEPSSSLSSAQSTLAAQESPEPEPSSVGQNLHQVPYMSRPRKIRKVTQSRIGTLARELRDARKDLVAIAKQQSSCMEMFAKAMQQIADNDRERNEMFRTLLLNQKSQAETASADCLSIVKDCIELLKKK